MPSQATAFVGSTHLATGPLGEVALAVRAALDAGGGGPVLTYDDASGRVLDLDLRGTPAEILARYAVPEPPGLQEPPRGRGRPKLGVVAREVTLLPRHWAWLNTQPGGASVALRKLVEKARHDGEGQDRLRQAQEAAYRFMSSAAGDEPGYEEALRAFFAADQTRFEALIQAWPADVRAHALRLAEPALTPERNP